MKNSLACFVFPLGVGPQVLMTLQEVFPAVKAAETAVKLRHVWWEGWQTLGRAQLSMGEVDLVSHNLLSSKVYAPAKMTTAYCY